MDDSYAKPEPPPSNYEALKKTLLELAEMRERIKRDREAAVQSWLDAMPAIDEREELRSVLSRTEERFIMATTAIASLESLLKSTSQSIMAKQDEENKAKIVIQEMRQSKDRYREEMKALKLEIDDEMRARAKLKDELRIRRQTLRTWKLTHRAVSLEIETFNKSADTNLHPTKRDHTMVEISREEYHALTRKADRENRLADWYVSSSEEKRHAAELSKANALMRLEALCTEKQKREMQVQGGASMEANVLPRLEILYTENQQKDMQVQGGMPMEAFGMAEEDREEFRRAKATGKNTKVKAPSAHQTQLNRGKKSTATRKKSQRKKKSKSRKNITVRKPTFLQKIRSFLCVA